METLDRMGEVFGKGETPAVSSKDLARTEEGAVDPRLESLAELVREALRGFLEFLPEEERECFGGVEVWTKLDRKEIRVECSSAYGYDKGDGERLLRKAGLLQAYLQSVLRYRYTPGAPSLGFVWRHELPSGFYPPYERIEFDLSGNIMMSGHYFLGCSDGLVGYFWDGMEVFASLRQLVEKVREALGVEAFLAWGTQAEQFSLVVLYTGLEESNESLRERLAELVVNNTPLGVDFHGDYESGAEVVGHLIVRRLAACPFKSFSGKLFKVKA